MRGSNHLIGIINFLTFLLSVPILGGGIWLSSRANSTDCMKFLQWPLIIIGVTIMVISLAGFAGACYRNTCLLWLYLFAMFFVIAALIGFVIFAYVVTSKGSGRPVMNRVYRDYYLADYQGWLEERVAGGGYWAKIASCVRDSKLCANMGRTYGGVPESADMFYLRRLNSIQSGCCKPPTECGYVYVNETLWDSGGGMMGTSIDCSRWNNDQGTLCYNCDSCKAGVLASLKKSWRKVSVINIVVLIILVIVYVVGCAAFRNNRRMDNDESYGESRMTKSQPSIPAIHSFFSPTLAPTFLASFLHLFLASLHSLRFTLIHCFLLAHLLDLPSAPLPPLYTLAPPPWLLFDCWRSNRAQLEKEMVNHGFGFFTQDFHQPVSLDQIQCNPVGKSIEAWQLSRTRM